MGREGLEKGLGVSDTEKQKGRTRKAVESKTSALRYSAPALEKGLDILEFLSERARSYSLVQLADEMGRTKGEIFRMLAVLEARGYVERAAETDNFQVTDKLLRIGLRRPKYRALTEIARPVMEAFAAETRYPCHLAIASDEQIVVIGRAESPDLVGVTVRVGYRQPLLETGSGRCILAHMDEGPRTDLLTTLKRQRGKLDLVALEAEGKRLRKKGFVIEESRIMEGVWDISCPILGKGSEKLVAAITAPYVRLVINRHSKEEVATRLRTAAEEISARLSEV
jgi:DNA-binding IclR family transcriptional regulator